MEINYKNIVKEAKEECKKRWGKLSKEDTVYLKSLCMHFLEEKMEEETLSDIVDNIITVFELEKN